VGLNLTAASHVILLEPSVNPALEEQAIGRVYWMGQLKPTTVKRLVVSDSVESRLADVVAAKVVAGLGDRTALTTDLVAADAGRWSKGKEMAESVPTVAGGLRHDRALVKYEELRALFGMPPRNVTAEL